MEDLEKAQSALTEHLNLTRKEKGCIKFEIVQDRHQLNKFVVYEEFIDQAAFELHQKRGKNSNWGGITQNVERHNKISTAGK